MKVKKLTWFCFSLVILGSMVLSSCAAPATQAPTAAAPAQAPTAAAPAVVQPTVAPAVVASTQPPAAPAAAKVLKVRLPRDINNMDPANVTGAPEDTIDRTVMEGLFRYNADGKLEPQLAETYKVSADGLTVDFTLRKGVKWQGGNGELTMDDVKFSYERFLATDPKPAYADDWASLDHVEIVDPYTGKLVLKKPQATLWTSVLPMTSGLIVSKKYYTSAGAEKIKTNIIGTGPYLFSEWTPKQSVVLKRNPDYWGKQPYFDEIDLMPVDDDKAAEVALQAGELDFSSISLASEDKFKADSNFTVNVAPSTNYKWIGMNVESPKLKDINVRQAIRYGIDVPSILAAAYNNKVPRANALIQPEGALGYWKDAPVYDRDVAKAKDFLAKAGLKSLDLTFTYENTDEFTTWAQIVQQNLKDVGINITLSPLDSSSFWALGEGGKDKTLELFALYYSSVVPDPAWSTQWFTCDQMDLWNWMRWCSKDFDALHQKGITTLDNAAREPIYIQMQQLWDAEADSVFVTDVPQVYVSKAGVKAVVYPGGLSPMLREFSGQ
ncbi:MAG TPA: ABC transporter substrate-binding protein [Anaerolineaceae bacterium]|jgi:peptide/nickel transport system substrate-binding protein